AARARHAAFERRRTAALPEAFVEAGLAMDLGSAANGEAHSLVRELRGCPRDDLVTPLRERQPVWQVGDTLSVEADAVHQPLEKIRVQCELPLGRRAEPKQHIAVAPVAPRARAHLDEELVHRQRSALQLVDEDEILPWI